MNFDFKTNENPNEVILEKRVSIPKMNKFKLFAQGFKMNFSLTRLPSAFWSISGLILAVTAMYFKVPEAGWAIPVACILYYGANHIIPFFVLAIALAGMALGIPQVAFLLIFSLITMVNWSSLS